MRYITIPINVENISDVDMGIKGETNIAEGILFVDNIAIMIQQPDGSTTIAIDGGDVNSPLTIAEIQNLIALCPVSKCSCTE